MRIPASRTLIAPALIALAWLTSAAPAAAGPRTAVVAVINTQAIQQGAAAMQSIRTQMQTLSANDVHEFAKQEDALRKAEQDLAAQRASLSAQAFKDRSAAIAQQITAFQQHVVARRRQLDAGLQSALDAVKAALADIIGQLARERGLELVLDGQSVVGTAGDVDLTAEAQARLDRRLPQLTLKLPPLATQ